MSENFRSKEPFSICEIGKVNDWIANDPVMGPHNPEDMITVTYS